MDIFRLRGDAVGRNRASRFGDLVFAVATAGRPGGSVADQTRLTLAALEQALVEAGSDKTRLLSATVYLTDIARKAEMDSVWCPWLGDDSANWPQRACVQAGLAPGDLVEITVIAAALR
ncbi:MAG: RidA family protein [Ectothiorhodospiraceae bacterium]|nr:RidA family protein [Ectothiorhodospiraceae bacterium]